MTTGIVIGMLMLGCGVFLAVIVYVLLEMNR